MRIMIPDGPVALSHLEPMSDPTFGNRNQRYSYSLRNHEGVPQGTLVGVTGGTLEWNATAQVKSGGRITVQQESRDQHDWTQLRIKIVMHIEGLGDYSLGVYIPSAPSEGWDDANLTLDIELLDKCSLLQQDAVQNTYSLPAGTVVTTAVRDLIASAGETSGSITSSSDTLSKAMTWEAGTSKLTIINDLLQAANFFSLYADNNGAFRVEKQRAAKSRPIRYEFLDNYKSVYLPTFTFDKDIYSIPNKVIVVGQGDAEGEAWTAVAVNQNPNSPYSYQQRGRWIVDAQRGVEATSQANLQEFANRRLAALSSPQGELMISHAPLPWLHINDAVRFRRTQADLDMRCVITNMKLDLNPTALATTRLQEVVDL